MNTIIGAERVYRENGCVYVIRDVWADKLGGNLERCEFKMKTGEGDGGCRWVPCREGVKFEDIQPYEYEMPAKNRAV